MDGGAPEPRDSFKLMNAEGTERVLEKKKSAENFSRFLRLWAILFGTKYQVPSRSCIQSEMLFSSISLLTFNSPGKERLHLKF